VISELADDTNQRQINLWQFSLL